MPALTSGLRWERALAIVLVSQLAIATAAAITIDGDAPSVCTVTGSGARTPEAARVREACEAAVPQVTAVWGSGWEQRVRLVLPASGAELRELVPGPGDPTEVTALADVDRVYVNPDGLARLSRSGLDAVLRHEITHLASQAEDPDVPIWLAEGLAEYVAFKGSSRAVDDIAQELAAELRAGDFPQAFPTGRQFDGPRLPAVHQESWLVVSTLARERGEAALLRVYRLVLAGASVDAALRTEDLTAPELVALWHEELRRLAG